MIHPVLSRYRSIQEEFVDTIGVIRIRKSKKAENTMVKRNKTKGQTMIYQNIAHKTKDRVTRTPLKTGGAPEG